VHCHVFVNYEFNLLVLFLVFVYFHSIHILNRAEHTTFAAATFYMSDSFDWLLLVCSHL
jgi:hypothetical protein